ncbi:MAG: ABC-F family ATP-binding cassette domain-containing protein, partial [Actinomycetes bacterium]
PATATVGYLPQEPERRDGETIAQFLGRRTGVSAATTAMEEASDALAAGQPGADDSYAVALETWLNLGGADFDERAEQVLASLGLGLDLAQHMTSLSGGQAARAGLASLLLSRYDVLLLDEPTNDLDLDGLARLEEFVRSQQQSRDGVPMVIVSHDREFLTRCVTTVVELDLAQQQVNVFGGGYASYLEEKDVARRHAREAYEEYADTVSELRDRARMQRSWADKGTRNAVRKATDGDKHVIYKNKQSSEKQAAKARITDKLIERLEVVEEPRKEWQLQMTIAVAPRPGAVVATLRDVVVHRGDFALGPVDAQVDWGDRVAITGPNGSGKTTLLAVLLGRLRPDSGTASLGPSVVVGEVDQARRLFGGAESEESLLDAFRGQVPDEPPAEVRTLLAKYGLGSEHVLRPCRSLSPGERTRAALALLQQRGVNLLVLDEPTNHLDLPAIEQLESALESYPGTLLLVSHDRRLLEAVNVTRRWQLDAGCLRE